MQKNLPRPFAVNERIYAQIYEDQAVPGKRREVERMINDEMVQILGWDSVKHPFPHAKVTKKA